MNQPRGRFVNPRSDDDIVEPMPVGMLRLLIETSLPRLNQAGTIGVAIGGVSVKEDGIANSHTQRMPLKVRGLASEFIELREEGGMVIVISEHVMEAAVREFLDKISHPLRGSVNRLAGGSQSTPAEIEDVSTQHKITGLSGGVSNRLKQIIAKRATGQQMQIRHEMTMRVG